MAPRALFFLVAVASVACLFGQAACLILPSNPANSAEGRNFPNPLRDPFYALSAGTSSEGNNIVKGAVIRNRTISSRLTSRHLATAHQVAFWTQDSLQRDDVGVATLFVPKLPAQDARILSVQVPEDSVSLDCNPSWALVQGSDSPNVIPVSLDAPFYVDWALSQGYYVVAPDHLGRQSAFIGGFQEGQTVLDGIRATMNFLKLAKNTPAALVGYSGGAHATVWAANMHETYGSDINIVGAVHGGTPVDPRGIYDFLVGGLSAGFAGAGLVGLGHGYPDLADYIQRVANEQGKADLARIASSGMCLAQLVASFPFKNFTQEANIPRPLDEPIPKAVLARESLLGNVSTEHVSVPRFPVLQLHAQFDEVVPRNQAEQFVDEQCARGGQRKYILIPLVEHLGGLYATIVPAIDALKQMYAGRYRVDVCGRGQEYSVPSIKSAEALAILGPDLAAALRAKDGSTPVPGLPKLSF